MVLGECSWLWMSIFGSTRNSQLRNDPCVHVCVRACVSVHVCMCKCASVDCIEVLQSLCSSLYSDLHCLCGTWTWHPPNPQPLSSWYRLPTGNKFLVFELTVSILPGKIGIFSPKPGRASLQPSLYHCEGTVRETDWEARDFNSSTASCTAGCCVLGKAI